LCTAHAPTALYPLSLHDALPISGDFRNALAGFPERSLHRCLDHALLQLIRERACWQLQSFIQRMDARGARPAVAHSLDLDGAKDGLQHASMQAPVGI